MDPELNRWMSDIQTGRFTSLRDLLKRRAYETRFENRYYGGRLPE